MKQREIKFRVWNGHSMEYNITIGKFGTFYVNLSNNGLDEKDSASLTPFTTKYHENTPVMQFTGLHDLQEKEIYIGDILEFENGDRVIVKMEEYLEVFVEPIGETECEDQWRDLYRIERSNIIGNIYSTPRTINPLNKER